MKKTFRIFGLFCIAVSLLTFAACGTDDDGDVTPPSDGDEEVIEPSDPSDDDDAATSTWLEEFQKKTGKRLTNVGQWKFSYDEKGRCINIEDGGGCAIDWNNRTITISQLFDDNYPAIYHFKTNKKGYITSMTGVYKADCFIKNSTTDFSYDKKGHLTKIFIKSVMNVVEDIYESEEVLYKYNTIETYTFEWEDGNLITISTKNESDNSGTMTVEQDYSRHINYCTQVNKYKQNCEFLTTYSCGGDRFALVGLIGMLGIGTENIPASSTSKSNIDPDAREYSRYALFTIDSNGLISSEAIDGYSHDYIYEDIH